ncbi:MAG: RNA 2',3'-cyclic phosphodiesterase [Desulfobacterales bacterium]|nr:MAG: RNA 2',3'-cyclic phosphodiesterase [Desulfobacterales bacterium]
MSQSLRSFIAIELPEAVCSLMERVQQDLKSLHLEVGWVRPQNIHLTLKFLGNISTGDIDKIGGAMKDAAKDFEPFTLTVGGLGFFPGIKRPRVIWVGVGGQTGQLFALQRNLEDRLAAVGFPREKRSFKGHLTLGRFRGGADPDRIRQIMQEYSDFGKQEFTTHRVVLFKSDLKPTGAVYSQLLQAELRNEY